MIPLWVGLASKGIDSDIRTSEGLFDCTLPLFPSEMCREQRALLPEAERMRESCGRWRVPIWMCSVMHVPGLACGSVSWFRVGFQCFIRNLVGSGALWLQRGMGGWEHGSGLSVSFQLSEAETCPCRRVGISVLPAARVQPNPPQRCLLRV